MPARTQALIASALLRNAPVAPGEVAYVVRDDKGEETTAVRMRHSWKAQLPTAARRAREKAVVVAWARAQVVERAVQIFDSAGTLIGEVAFEREVNKKDEVTNG